MNIDLGFQGKFKLEVTNLKGELKDETPWFNNLVLNSGLNRMGSGIWIDRVTVGNGTVEPQVTDIGLTSFLAASTTVTSHSAGSVKEDEGKYYVFRKVRFRFNAGVFSGTQVISEVGLGWNNANLWNKTLLKDENGDPTTITVTNSDFLDVICEVRCYFPTDFTDELTFYNLDGSVESEHTATCKFKGTANLTSNHFYPLNSALSVSSFGLIGEIGNWQNPNIYSGLTGVTREDLTNRSFKTTQPLNLTSGVGEHKTLLISVDMFYATSPTSPRNGVAGFQCELDPPINKDNTFEMSYDFTISWDRYTG